MNQRNHRVGFTLVELLVVIAIIGVLVGLLLPAVQSAREAARRMDCGNRVKQIGLAIHNYHSAFNRLPRAWWLEMPPQSLNGGVWSVAILPFLEEQAIYEQYDFSRLPVNEFSPANVELVQTIVPAYLCPSTPGDPGSRRYFFDAAPDLPVTATDLAPNDFMVTTGVRGAYRTHAYGSASVSSSHGAMQVFGPYGDDQEGAFAGILDGLSNTFLLGERTGGNLIYSNRRVDQDATNALVRVNGGGWGDLLNGEQWIQGSLKSGLGWPTPVGGPCAINCTNARGYGFHSFHTGGSHFLLADGAVRFFTESVNPHTFASHITRRNGEVIQQD